MMVITKDNPSELERKKNLIDTLYHHSDLSVESISYQADMSIKQVQGIIDKIRKKEALEVLVEHSKTPVEKIMTKIVVSLESGKTIYDASVLMAKKRVGSLVVTSKGKPLGIVTKGDLVKGISTGVSFKNVSLEQFATRPLIYASSRQTIEEVADLMIKNKIRKLPVIQQGKIAGIVTVTDLAMFLSPTRRPGLTESIFHVITRENARKR
ncbi:CBS domain-containing protein [Candidatus Nitrosotalea okcheonensis]|uniref:Putative CBS domain protein n=1 Tax=Candidatus Nitrosotalea okcheonensis TaxID=1903276 RepID=A0A2H1FF58_9ARCH|nr:CBS domain-containing protein [Candidatus Nitrosotalea okcheonensis]MDE1832167.1 CBS domain-containing protein [Nitrososphaerota archaeon]MDE1878625.1 CBS domain-containing protein [Nitrososphaerota archaeon]SMH71406.1 putative CBS domain protein [Candidatus Nitrosotalea okcheonensis]